MKKVLIFAHKPPPHHGQSYMVQLLLEGLRGGQPVTSLRQEIPSSVDDDDISCIHLDARYSTDNEDVGQARLGKVFLALKYALQAIWWRFRHKLDTLYYVPAFPARTPIYRDWIVLGLCRPFFGRTVFHWHAVGLGDWLINEAHWWEAWVSRFVFGRPDLSIVLRPYNKADAVALQSKRIAVVANGVPDLCPNFESMILPRRLARCDARRRLLRNESIPPELIQAAGDRPEVFKLLFVSLCYSGKGLFDTLEAVGLVNQELRDSQIGIELNVAGKFWIEEERLQFMERIRRPDMQRNGMSVVNYLGFVGGEAKNRLFIESDCLCFPTRMPESFGLVLVEGMACGLPLITTNWRNIPEILPPNSTGIVDIKSPRQIANAIIDCISADYDPKLRSWYLECYTVDKFINRMRRAITEVPE